MSRIKADRYNELMANKAELNNDELRDGWHFCVDWDFLLIHPQDKEYEVCTCTKYRCTWCMIDTVSNPCVCCNNTTYPKNVPCTTHSWSRLTIQAHECKMCGIIQDCKTGKIYSIDEAKERGLIGATVR